MKVKHKLSVLVLVFAMSSTSSAVLTLRIVDNNDGTFGIESTTPYTGVADDMLFAAVTVSSPYPSGGTAQPAAPAETEILPFDPVDWGIPLPPGEHGVWGYIGDSMGVAVPAGTYIDGIQSQMGATIKLYKNDDFTLWLLLHTRTLGAGLTGFSWSGVGYETFGPDVIYEQISSLQPGRIYRVLVSFKFDFQHEGMWGTGSVTCRVGTDPNGGTNPDVVTNWMSGSDSSGGDNPYDGPWIQVTTFFSPNATVATVFIAVTGHGNAESEEWIDPWFPEWWPEPWDAECYIDDVVVALVEIWETSTVEATSLVPANGVHQSEVTITVVDPCGVPIEGIPASEIDVNCTGSGNIISGPDNPTDENGQTTARISSTVAEVKTVSVTVLGTLLSDTANVEFGEVYLGPIWHVDASNIGYGNGSPEQPFRTISDAIIPAQDGDTVIVLPGTYYEKVDYSGKELTIRSADPKDPVVVASTIIDANGSGSAVFFDNYQGRDSVLSGFTITGGNANDGGGIHCSGFLSVQDNVVTGNYASDGGGGIYCDGYIAIRDNLIAGNTAASRGGGICCWKGYPTIKANLILGNVASDVGGGIYGWSASPEIQDNIIADNFGGFGGGLYDCDGMISNCMIINNSTTHNSGKGGGLSSCDGTILNCSIAFNDANDKGGGLWDCHGPVKHCIIWSNVAGGDGAQLWDSSEPTYSCIQDWAGAGIGNITDDPLFADPDVNDFHVLSEAGRWDPSLGDWVTDVITSPCIDGGDPLSKLGIELNPNGARINMGYYGGTTEASKSTSGIVQTVCTEYPPMDFNKDCKVDFADFTTFCSAWLECNLDPPEECW